MKKSKKLIVVVAGKKGSGKNTLCNQMAVIRANWLLNHAASKFLFVDTRFSLTPKGEILQEGNVIDLKTEWQGAINLSFAEPIKQFCVNVLGFSPEQCYGTDEQKNSVTQMTWEGLINVTGQKYTLKGCMTARQVMQIFGTEIMRNWHQNVWADACANYAIKCPARLVLISDCRFPNEVEVFKNIQCTDDLSVKIVKLTRNPYNDEHISEKALDNYPLDKFDYIMPEVSLVEQYELIALQMKQWLA